MELKPDAYLYEGTSMVYKETERRPDLVERGYTETPIFYRKRSPTDPLQLAVEALEARLTAEQERAAVVAWLRAENARLTEWKPIETAPDDDWFLAAIEVSHKSGGHWWEYHVVWLDDETGDIHTDCEQGWSISDYSHWVALPDAPYPLNETRAAGEPTK